MKERVIIVGAGTIFRRYRSIIENQFQVLAVADNNKSGQTVDGYICIRVDEIILYDYQKVIICSTWYEYVLREQLSDLGIPDSRIHNIESIQKSLYYDSDIRKYKTDRDTYIEKCTNGGIKDFCYEKEDAFPVLSEHREAAGSIEGHYFLMDIMMAREVIQRKPACHFDIGSRIDGFIAHLLAENINTTVIDIRPLDEISAGGIQLNFMQADATNLENIPDNSIESLSALHSVEHFGLGRYGDKIDPQAHLKAMRAMQRVLGDNGYLYFAVPVGSRERLCFNAHRIFSPLTILDCFQGLKLEKMYLLHDVKFYEYSLEELREEKFRDIIGGYDCGVYIFKKVPF